MRQYTPDCLIPLHVSMKVWKRFLSKISISESGCWLWTSTQTSKGYGQFRYQGGMKYAHRLAYIFLRGGIPEGKELDHLCRVRNCVNPDHLEPVTSKENTLRGLAVSAINAQKTHCLRGHEFTPENTLVKLNGSRDCRICNREREQRRQITRKANRVRTGNFNKNKTHCCRGHEFTPENTRVDKRGRTCRTCHRERESARQKNVVRREIEVKGE